APVRRARELLRHARARLRPAPAGRRAHARDPRVARPRRRRREARGRGRRVLARRALPLALGEGNAMSRNGYHGVNKMNVRIIDEFRANGGKVGGGFEGRPIVLLTIKGRTTGTERTTPLVYLPHDGRVFVFASKGGAPEDPDWYKNLVANPDVAVEIGDEQYAAQAVVIT